MEKPFALIIEDERDIAALYRHVLDMAGYRTELIFHGDIAVQRLSHCQPDIILLDLNLPGIPGNEIIEIIRADTRLDRSKVIVISGYAGLSDSLNVEPDLTLLKPVSTEQLTNLIARIQPVSIHKATPILEKPWVRNTGIYNQSFFLNRLDFSLKHSKEIDPYLFAVLLFKVDIKNGIRNLIDEQNWDSILCEVADSLKNTLRPTDTIARFDQDNIYILIENVPNGNIPVMIANRIQEKLYDNIVDIGNKIQIPIRIGILLCDSSYESTDEILRDAQHAQMLASAQGYDYYKYYYQVSKKKQSL